MRELHQGDRPSDELIARCITGQATPDERARVQAWRMAGPESEAAYRRLERLLKWSARLPETLRLGAPPTSNTVLAAARHSGASDAGAVKTDARSGAHAAGPPDPATARPSGGDAGHASDAAKEPRNRARGSTRLRQWLLTAAAMLVIGLTFTFFLRPDGAPGAGFSADSFLTGPSETATITLRDGTVVRLAPGSRLQLEPSRTGARVFLEGRAFFAVAHQKGSSFVVRTRTGEIRVLGTRFDLAARDDDLQLLVVEGRVAVSADGLDAEVQRGQISRIVKGIPLPVVEVADPHELTDWVGPFLAFQATPLADVAREIARQYNVPVEVTDTALARRTITAWFSDWALDDVMMVVCTVADAHCRRTDGAIVIAPVAHSSPR